MTLRETIEQALFDYCYEDASADQATNEILAAIREHMTSPEGVERALGGLIIYDMALAAKMHADMKAAILAALGEE